MKLLLGENCLKLLLDFQHSSYDVFQKFPIYFAVIFVSYLRWVCLIFVSKFLIYFAAVLLFYVRWMLSDIHQKFPVYFAAVFCLI